MTLEECFEAINPGVDLRFVDYRLIAHAAVVGEKCVSWVPPAEYRKEGPSAYEQCKACLEIVYARARGVFFPSAVVAAASETANKAISVDWSDGFQAGLDGDHDFGAAILSCAASIDPKVRAESIYWAVLYEWDRSPIVYSAEARQFWIHYSKLLLTLIREAPRQRLMILNVESVFEHAIGRAKG